MPVITEQPQWGTPPALPKLPDYTPKGPWGITPNVSPFMSPNFNWINAFSQRTPSELAHVQNISDLARLISGQGTGLFNIGSPAYSQALNYYRRLLEGSRPAVTEAVAPEAQAIGDIYKGAQSSLAAGSLRGGARDLATGELARQKAGQIAGLAAQVRPGAAAAAGQLGLQGATAGTAAEQAGAGIYGNLLGQEQQSRQAAQGQALQQQNLGLQASLGAARLTLDDLVQSGQLGLEEYKALTGNNLALGRLTLDQYLGQGNLTLHQKDYALRLKQYQDQQAQNKGSIWGKIIGSALSFIPGIGGPLSQFFGGGNFSGLFGGGGSKGGYYDPYFEGAGPAGSPPSGTGGQY